MLVQLPNDGWSFPPRVNEARIDRGSSLARRLQFATIPDDRPFNLVTKTFCYAIRTGAKAVGGESGTALRFGGAASGDQLRFTDAKHSIGDKYTGALSITQVPHTWVFRFKAFSVSTRGGLMQYTDQDAGGSGLYAFLEAADSTVRYSVESSITNYTSSPTYTLNKWHTVAFTYDPASNKLNSYLDGRRGTEATEASPTTNTSISKFLIGDCFDTFNRELDGEISLFAFWDRALTPREGRFLTHGDNWLTLFEGEQSVFFPAESVGGTTYNVTVSESFSFADVDSEIGTFPRTAADTFSFNDAPSETAAFVRTLEETLSITDEATGSTAILVTILESLAFTDSSSETATFARQVLETLNLADAGIETAALLRAVVESLVLTDAATATGGEQQEPESTGGGSSMTLRQMRRLERQQLLDMIRKDDDVVLSLIAGILRNGNKRN